VTDPLQFMTGPQGGRALAVAVAAAGGTLLTWRPCHVDHRPGRVTVSYRARIRWRGAVRPRTETLGATTGGALPAGVTVVGDGDTRIGVWQVPHDPDLPGLAAATDDDAVSRLLSRVGLGSRSARTRLVAYRPRRRAIVEASAGSARLFVKVVRPPQARRLHERHRLFSAAGVPVPRSLGWTDDGLVVLEALPGRTLREALRTQAGPWPDIDALTDLLGRLPRELPGARRRRSWSDRAPDYASMVGAASPDLAPRAHHLAAAIRAECEDSPPATVHGDLYEQQILVDGRTVCGLLDLDTAGPGDPLDDLACLVGHLSVLAQVWPDRASTISQLGVHYLDELERRIDSRQLRLRIAAVALSLATGPHRVQEAGWRDSTLRRIELVERWLDSARRAGRAGPVSQINHLGEPPWTSHAAGRSSEPQPPSPDSPPPRSAPARCATSI
jgi:aminoglycoside phosphotransferase